jgi:DNA-binding transcriptional regulator YhcF (GntR family)
MSVADRFPDRLGESFVAIPRELRRRREALGLTTDELVVFESLEDHRREPGQLVRPSVRRLHRLTGVSPRQVRRALAGLEGKGWLAVHRAPGKVSQFDVAPGWELLAARVRELPVEDEDKDDTEATTTQANVAQATTTQARVTQVTTTQATTPPTQARVATDPGQGGHRKRRDVGRERTARAPAPPSDNGNDDDGGQRSPSKPSRRRPAPPDPDALPDSFPERLAVAARAAHPILARLATAKGANDVTLLAVARAVETFPDRDHGAVAADVEHYWTFGLGASKPMADVVATYRNRLAAVGPALATSNGTAPTQPIRERDLRRPELGGAR